MREKIQQLETFIDKLKRHKDSPTLIELAEFLLSLLKEGATEPNAEQPNNAALPGGETSSGENGKDSTQEIPSQSDTPSLSEGGGTPDTGAQGVD